MYYLSLVKLNRLRFKYGMKVRLNSCGKGLCIVHLGSIITNGDVGEDARLFVNSAIVSNGGGEREPRLAEYARKKGLYVEQIKAWKDACMNANGGVAKEASRLNRELKDFEKERRKLEKELQRKEKALAEAEALLVLSKKANAIWGESEDE